jgi:hypothetical protein
MERSQAGFTLVFLFKQETTPGKNTALDDKTNVCLFISSAKARYQDRSSKEDPSDTEDYSRS